MRILMIEDNAANAYLARFLLERRGHEVVTATTGSEGVVRAAEARYDVILLDLRLPDGDGCDFVAPLRAGPNAAAPIVVVSAHALAADHERARSVGCVGFIDKPLDVATFADRIERMSAIKE